MPVATLLLAAVFVAPPPARPNVVLIVADDMGYADAGFQGSDLVPTPRLDALAASGVVCASGYSTHPFCSPMRAALLTGRYQQRFGYENNVPFDHFNPLLGLPEGERTVADRLTAAGYDTALVGKWHLGASSKQYPTNRGFGYFHGFPGGGHDYFSIDLAGPVGSGYRWPLHRAVAGGAAEPATFEGYLTDHLSGAAADYIAEDRDAPFFLALTYNAPHTPLQAPQKYLDRIDDAKLAGLSEKRAKKRKTYAAMVAALDDGVGRVVAALEESGPAGEHAGRLHERQRRPGGVQRQRQRPPPRRQGNLYEGGVRVPMLLSLPGTLPAGRVYESPIASIDLTRTAVALAGGDAGGMEGEPLVDALSTDLGGADPLADRPLFWRKSAAAGGGRAVRRGDWKLVDPGDGSFELYHLADDLGEARDLAAENPARVAELKAVWDGWNAANRPPAFPGFRDYLPARRQFHGASVAPPADE